MEAEVLEKHLRKTTILSNVVSLIVALFMAMGVGYGFYWKTKTTLKNHGDDLQELKENVIELDNQLEKIQVFKGVSSEEVKNLSERVEKIDTRIEKIDDKLDKILLQTR